MYITRINHSIIREFNSGHNAEIKEIQVSHKKKPMELIMNYMQEQINNIDRARREIREKYPKFLPRLK